MKKMNKKVVIATTLSLASMVLTAACGYGPATYEPYDDGSSYEATTDDKNNNESSFDNTKDDYPEPEPETVYGPPVAD